MYPIYIDAKRAYGTGQRRIPREKSVWWPLSRDMAEAAGRLGLGTLHEAQKFHPRDWDNPGRVRVQLKKDGKLVNPKIRNSAFSPLLVLRAVVCAERSSYVPDSRVPT